MLLFMFEYRDLKQHAGIKSLTSVPITMSIYVASSLEFIHME